MARRYRRSRYAEVPGTRRFRIHMQCRSVSDPHRVCSASAVNRVRIRLADIRKEHVPTVGTARPKVLDSLEDRRVRPQSHFPDCLLKELVLALSNAPSRLPEPYPGSPSHQATSVQGESYVAIGQSMNSQTPGKQLQQRLCTLETNAVRIARFCYPQNIFEPRFLSFRVRQ